MRYNGRELKISGAAAERGGNMDDYSFSLFPNENFMDLRLYQYGWEQCAPLHSFGPFVRNHYLFHYVISGRGLLSASVGGGVKTQAD